MNSDINNFDDAFGMFVLLICICLFSFFAGMWVERLKNKNSK